MTPDDYIRTLAVALTRREDTTVKEARSLLFELALRVRGLLLSNLPDTGLARALTWSRLRQYVTPLIETASRRISALLATALIDAQPPVLRALESLLDLPAETLRPQPLSALAYDIRVLAQRLTTLFTPIPPLNVSPFTQQLLRLLDRTVSAGLLRDDPTPLIADAIYASTPRFPRLRRLLSTAAPTSQRRNAASAQRGTVANAWVARTAAVTAAALWSLPTPAAQTALNEAIIARATTTAPQWRWHTILDPKTCPICYPLDQLLAPTPTDFPQGPPPLHPRCRCLAIPELI